MPDLTEDYWALRKDAGAVWLPRDFIIVDGPDAGSFLQGQLSQDVEQLKPGGRMVIPVGNPFQTQMLMLVTKGRKGPRDLQVRNLMPVAFVPLVGGPRSN